MKIDPDARTGREPLVSRRAIEEGSLIPRRDGASYPIPETLNLSLVAVQMMAALGLLAVGAHARSLTKAGLLAVAFAFVMQMGFCLAHEAVHGKLHRRKNVNEGLGILLFALFPGSFHFFEIAHLLHHKRNRSDAELEDYVMPTEIPWQKRVAYYFLICGFFWFLIPLASILIAMIPRRNIRIPAPGEDAGVFRRFLQFLNGVSLGRMRRDLLITAAVWVAAELVFHFSLRNLALFYAAFGFSWASQQYIYHVRTPRHAVLGAYDLRLWRRNACRKLISLLSAIPKPGTVPRLSSRNFAERSCRRFRWKTSGRLFRGSRRALAAASPWYPRKDTRCAAFISTRLFRRGNWGLIF
jgi:hypothetical protein